MSWADISTTKSRERSTCARPGCSRKLGPSNRSGHCNAHAPRPRGKPTVGDTTARARAFVRAWLHSHDVPASAVQALPQQAKDALAARVEELFAGQALRPRLPSAGTQARRALDAGLVQIGTPRQLSPSLATEPDMRSPECAAYTLCLEHVLAQGWQAWTCRGCDGPGVAQEHATRKRGPRTPRRGKYE